MKKNKKTTTNSLSALEKSLSETLPKNINVKDFMASEEMMDILYRMIGSELELAKK